MQSVTISGSEFQVVACLTMSCPLFTETQPVTVCSYNQFQGGTPQQVYLKEYAILDLLVIYQTYEPAKYKLHV